MRLGGLSNDICNRLDSEITMKVTISNVPRYVNNALQYFVLVALNPMLGRSTCHHGMARPRVADGRDGLQLEVSCEYIE
jgi:hypothetical protein